MGNETQETGLSTKGRSMKRNQKLTRREAEEIIGLLHANELSQHEIGQRFSVLATTISLIARDQTWRNVPRPWPMAELPPYRLMRQRDREQPLPRLTSEIHPAVKIGCDEYNPRVCLGCNAIFRSHGPGHRICRHCKARNDKATTPPPVYRSHMPDED